MGRRRWHGAAVEALSDWRAETPRVNGQLLAPPVVVRVTFGSR